MPEPKQSIAEIQDEIVDNLSLFDDWADRYAYVIELGQKLERLPDELKTDEYKVRGCQSQVWIVPKFNDGVVTLKADSDAPTVKGLIAMLLAIYSGRTPREILATEPDFIDRTGLADNLSMLRVNGLRASAKQIKKYAATYEQRGA